MSWSHDYWPKEHHDYIMGLIRADHGGALPEWALAVDLVFLADKANHPSKPEPFLGRRKLEERWNVSERVLRRVLASKGWREKCETSKIPVPDRTLQGHGPAGGQGCPRERTTSVPVGVPQLSPSPPPSPTGQPAQLSENVPVTVPVSVPVGVPQASPWASTPPSKMEDSPLFSGLSGLRVYGSTEKREEATRPTHLQLVEDPTPAPITPPPAPLRKAKPAAPPPVPPWTLNFRNVPPREAFEAVVDALNGIRAKPVQPARCAEEAKLYRLLWETRGHPPVAELTAQVCLVARWARESDDPAAARNLRAEGWAEGTNKSRTVSTILDPKKFGDRLELAEAWLENEESRHNSPRSQYRTEPEPEVILAAPPTRRNA